MSKYMYAKHDKHTKDSNEQNYLEIPGMFKV